MTVFSTPPDFNRLPLRALVACALRSASRVQPLIQERDSATTGNTKLSNARVNNIALLLCQTFCREGLNVGSRLSDLVDEAKWNPPREFSDEAYHPALESGRATFFATQNAAFGNKAMPGVATISTATAVREQTTAAIQFALEAVCVLGKDAQNLLQNAVDRDVAQLASLNLGFYPEIGGFLDPTETGPLGALWPSGEPTDLRALDKTTELARPATFLAAPQTASTAFSQMTDIGNAVEPNPTTSQPPRLCRYFRPNRLIQALREKKLYCATLSSFNDPFDGQLYSHYRFGKKELIVAVREEITRLNISGERVPDSESPLPLQALIQLYQDGAFEGMTSDVFLEFVSSSLESQKFNFEPPEVERTVIPQLADQVRVLCFSEEHDNLLLWAHYTEDHKGGVIRLRSDKGSPYLPLAQPVRYSRDIPPNATPSDVARTLLGFSIDSRAQMARQFYTKSQNWAYEKEWRVLMKHQHLDKNHCAEILEDDIEAIYLGCRMNLSEKRSVLDIVEEQYPNATVYQMLKDDQEFCLNVVPVYSSINAPAEDTSQRISQLNELYRSCLKMYLRFWNEPQWQEDLFTLEMLKLDATLGQRSPPAIRRIFRQMLDQLQHTFKQNASHQSAENVSHKLSEDEKIAMLRPSAILLRELCDVMNEHLVSLGGTPIDINSPT